MSVLLLNNEHVRSVAPELCDIVSLIEQAYRLDSEGKAEVPTKIGVHPSYPNSFLHAMPAWVDDVRALGLKWISYFPGNSQKGIPDSSGIIILNSPDDGRPCCIMEGMHITFARTASCAAIAAKYLLASPPKSLGLVGCGGLGLWSLRIMGALFPSIERVMVSSRSPESRKLFCAEHSPEGPWTLIPVDHADDAVRDVDVLISSVPPGDARPVRGDVLGSRTLFIPLDLTNSWDDSVMGKAQRVVADDPNHFSTRVETRRKRSFPALARIDRLQGVVSRQTERSKLDERTLVAICGIASTDLVLAWDIYRRALKSGIGMKFDMLSESEWRR
jgi:alanine dehydrogenase